MQAKVKVQVPIKIGTTEMMWEVYVAPIEDHMLLGLDFMQAADVLVRTRGDLLVGDTVVTTRVETSAGVVHAVAQVRAVEDVCLEPGQEYRIAGRVLAVKPILGVLEPAELRGGLIVGSVWTEMKSLVPVNVFNASNSKRCIKKGQYLGKLVESEDMEQNPKEANTFGIPKVRRASMATPALVPEHLQQVFASATQDMTNDETVRVAQLFNERQKIFAKDDMDLGCSSIAKHTIDTGGSRPRRQPARRTPLGFQEEEEKHLTQMLDAGVVVPSTSDWASPVVLVRKKDGGVRWCVDYRQLNEVTVKDCYPIPKIEECLDTLSGAKYFSTMDLQSGYWQLEVDPADRHKTAFITRNGLFEYTRMPFGLCNGPGTFQRAMELVFRGLQWKSVLIYLDDVIVVSSSFEEHLQCLADVFTRFEEAGLKLKPKKCQFFQSQVVFLGHLVGRDGVKTNPELIHDVVSWPEPSTVRSLQAFLGLCNYYRRFIHNFSEVAGALHALLKKGVEFTWGEEQNKAFLALKHQLTQAPILAYPSKDSEFILDTDASNSSIGAVLSQTQEGEERVIAYSSKRLGPSQQRYCVTRRELLAVVTFTRQFRHYLLGRRFLLRTDHGSLTRLFRFKAPQGQLARWLEELSQYNFDIQHRQGAKHGNADSLSRRPGEDEECDCYHAGEELSELPCKGCKYCARLHQQWSRFEEDVDYVVPIAVRRVQEGLVLQDETDTVTPESLGRVKTPSEREAFKDQQQTVVDQDCAAGRSSRPPPDGRRPVREVARRARCTGPAQWLREGALWREAHPRDW